MRGLDRAGNPEEAEALLAAMASRVTNRLLEPAQQSQTLGSRCVSSQVDAQGESELMVSLALTKLAAEGQELPWEDRLTLHDALDAADQRIGQVCYSAGGCEVQLHPGDGFFHPAPDPLRQPGGLDNRDLQRLGDPAECAVDVAGDECLVLPESCSPATKDEANEGPVDPAGCGDLVIRLTAAPEIEDAAGDAGAVKPGGPVVLAVAVKLAAVAAARDRAAALQVVEALGLRRALPAAGAERPDGNVSVLPASDSDDLQPAEGLADEGFNPLCHFADFASSCRHIHY